MATAGTARGRPAKQKPTRAAPVALAVRWTPAKREAFLAALVETANVAGAARTVGLPPCSPYKLRAKDADFRAAWEAALEEAYSRLELMLLRRATFGETCDGPATPKISTTFAMALLRHHQTRARRGAPDLPRKVGGSNLRNRLEEKLAEIERRHEPE
jgi:hypothetical protein